MKSIAERVGMSIPQLEHSFAAFQRLPQRQQEIAGAIAVATSIRREALQVECAFIGHTYYFYPTICSACGRDKDA